MEEVHIRRAVLPDIPYLYDICLKTGNEGKDATSLFFDPYAIGHYYAAPYLLYPDGICFVAEYGYRPQGYIIAAPDTIAFHKWMEEQWLPVLRIRYQLPFPAALIRSENEKRIIELFHKCQFPVDMSYQPWLADYPAHLHIDMLPVLQGKGVGRALIDNLFTELARQGVPGLHLNVSSANEGAVAFYKKMNFSVLVEYDWGFTMGRKVK
ncbi:MAG: GNAT family N-acetyltransferase [Treponema sp.]|jgi:GNAT superfamily N-acetyltransferase|nr:GNAT family N-acetyltransferase [Treponema sp.]